MNFNSNESMPSSPGSLGAFMPKDAKKTSPPRLPVVAVVVVVVVVMPSSSASSSSMSTTSLSLRPAGRRSSFVMGRRDVQLSQEPTKRTSSACSNVARSSYFMYMGGGPIGGGRQAAGSMSTTSLPSIATKLFVASLASTSTKGSLSSLVKESPLLLPSLLLSLLSLLVVMRTVVYSTEVFGGSPFSNILFGSSGATAGIGG
mmetsp:Transcript_8924/g.20269  ORF Transcript_8924/g.20269 Transcript_8924/m.20269 type:complete len:202 (-) Transcript_8924:539-1144(-)